MQELGWISQDIQPPGATGQQGVASESGKADDQHSQTRRGHGATLRVALPS